MHLLQNVFCDNIGYFEADTLFFKSSVKYCEDMREERTVMGSTINISQEGFQGMTPTMLKHPE